MTSMATIKVAFFDLGGTLINGARNWVPGAREILFALRSRGIRLGLISNTGDLSRNEILKLLPKNFDMSLFENNLVVFSSEVKVKKPDAQIFQLAIKRAAVVPNECLFCDDELPNTAAAKKQGMRVVLIQNQPNIEISKLIEKLTSAGLILMEIPGFLSSKLERIGKRSEGPAYYLQQFDYQEINIVKKAERGKKEPTLQQYLGRKITVTGRVEGKRLNYEKVGLYRPQPKRCKISVAK
jgi:predicted HAD superfamily phosphohydrolase YqeG